MLHFGRYALACVFNNKMQPIVSADVGTIGDESLLVSFFLQVIEMLSDTQKRRGFS